MAVRLSEATAGLVGDVLTQDGTRDAVTVADACRLLLPGSRVVGGASGLSRRVTWAATLRSRPPAFEPRGGGEFVLASAAVLESLRQTDPSLTLPRVLDGLAQVGAAALALPSPIPPEATAAADALSLPLIEAPPGASLLDVERGIIALVVDRRNEVQARAGLFSRRLAQLSAGGHGLHALVQEAAAATGRTVAFEDSGFRLRSVAAPPTGRAPEVDGAGLSSIDERGRLAEAVRSQPVSSATPAATLLTAVRWGMARCAAPVVTRGQVRGFVSLCGAPDSLTEFDQLAASRAAEILALELAKEEAVLAAEQRVQGDLVDELLDAAADQEATARRAAQAGLSVDGTFGVFAFALDSSDARPPGLRLEDAAHRLERVAAAISRHAKRAREPMLVRPEAAELVVVCQVADGRQERPHTPQTSHYGQVSYRGNGAGRAPADPAAAEAPVVDTGFAGDARHEAERRLRSIGEALLEATAREAAGSVVAAGASRAHAPLAALPQAAREAREALRIGRRVYGAGRLVCYGDLGLYRVLHALRDSPELRSFYEQMLGPLADYDRRTGQNLIDTLDAFFACHGNLKEAAKRLDLHRNSLRYRMGRIREVGGLDLEDPETRLSLQVALKARRLLA